MSKWPISVVNDPRFAASIETARRYISRVPQGGAARLVCCCLLAAVTCGLVGFLTLRVPLGYDGAKVLEPAISIATRFAYEELYVPGHLYDPDIQVHGPLIYVGAIGYAMTHNPDVSLVAGTVSGTAVVLVGLLLLRTWLIVLPLVLLFLWPTYYYVSTSFLGELWAVGTILIGVAILRRLAPASSVKELFADKRVWLACLLFGIAVTSKLLTLAIVYAVSFAAVYEMRPSGGLVATARNIFSSLIAALLVSAVAATCLLLDVAIAALYTTRSLVGLAKVPGVLAVYVHENVGLANLSHGVMPLTTQFGVFSNHLLLALVLLAGLMLVALRPSYALLVAFWGILWLDYSLNERRMLPMFLVILILGLNEAPNLVSLAAKRWRVPVRSTGVIAAAALCAVIILLNPLVGATASLQSDPQREYAVDIQSGPSGYHYEYHYQPRLIAELRRHRYALADGVFEFPEISDFWRVRFYNRLAPENASLWNGDTVLLFDKDNVFWPTTTVHGNCGSVIDEDGPLVLCRLRPDVALDYQPPATPVPSRNARIALLTSDHWRLTTNMRRTANGPHGSAEYIYIGTGTLDSVEDASLTLPVHPGRVYAFSAWVDPSQILEGKFDLVIDSADASSTYAAVFEPVGPPARYWTNAWLCPRGVTRVQVSMQAIWLSVAPGRALRFSFPELSDASQ